MKSETSYKPGHESSHIYKGMKSTAKPGEGRGHIRQMDKKGRLRCSAGGEWKLPESFPPDKRRTFGRGSCCRFHLKIRHHNIK